MIGDDIAAALPELRAQAESMMQDRCAITMPGARVWVDVSGTYSTTPAVLYAGQCRVQRPSAADRPASAGEAGYVLGDVVVSLPVTAPAVPVGAAVTVTESAHDPMLSGSVFSVLGPHRKTYATARRYECVEVTRP